jgi:hypothetical protein
VYFSTNFCLVFCFFFYQKDTNPVLKYLIFFKKKKNIKNIKILFCFHAYGQVSQG